MCDPEVDRGPHPVRRVSPAAPVGGYNMLEVGDWGDGGLRAGGEEGMRYEGTWGTKGHEWKVGGMERDKFRR